jgi:hypothetical protein
VVAPLWNKVAGASSPSRRCHGWRSHEASDGWCSRICRFGERSCSWPAGRDGGGGRLLVLLSLNLFFVSVWLLLVMLWRCWGWCGLVLVALAARPRRLYRSCSRSSFLLFVGEEDDDLLSVRVRCDRDRRLPVCIVVAW